MVAPRSIPVPDAEGSESGYARSRGTRKRILAAALEEAAESGFHKTSVARIAARAGVAIGSLHYHFGSRDELLRELMAQLMTHYTEWVEAAEAETDGDYFARKRAVLLAYVAHVRGNPDYAHLAAEIKLHEPELYRSGERTWVERLAARLREGIAEGALRPMDDAEILLKAHFLIGARRALEDLARSDASLDDEAIVDAWLDIERGGLERR